MICVIFSPALPCFSLLVHMVLLHQYKPPTPTRKLSPLPPTVRTTTQPPPTETLKATTAAAPPTSSTGTEPTTLGAESSPPFVRILSQATASSGSLSEVEEVTTGGFSEEAHSDKLSITDETLHTTFPSSTSGQIDSDVRLEPSGEVFGSAASREVGLLTGRWGSEEPDSPLGEGEKAERGAEVDSLVSSQSPRAAPSAEHQSDSWTGSYPLVSVDDVDPDPKHLNSVRER